MGNATCVNNRRGLVINRFLEIFLHGFEIEKRASRFDGQRMSEVKFGQQVEWSWE